MVHLLRFAGFCARFGVEFYFLLTCFVLFYKAEALIFGGVTKSWSYVHSSFLVTLVGQALTAKIPIRFGKNHPVIVSVLVAYDLCYHYILVTLSTYA